MLKAKRVKN